MLGIGQFVAGFFLEKTAAGGTGAGMIGVLNVVGHDAVHTGFIDRFKGGEIRPDEIRIIEAHGPAMIIGTGPLAGAAVDLAHGGGGFVIDDDGIGDGELAQTFPRIDGGALLADETLHILPVFFVLRAEGQPGGMMLDNLNAMFVAGNDQLAQRRVENIPVGHEIPAEMGRLKGGNKGDFIIAQAEGLPVKILLRIAEYSFVVEPVPFKRRHPWIHMRASLVCVQL